MDAAAKQVTTHRGEQKTKPENSEAPTGRSCDEAAIPRQNSSGQAADRHVPHQSSSGSRPVCLRIAARRDAASVIETRCYK